MSWFHSLTKERRNDTLVKIYTVSIYIKKYEDVQNKNRVRARYKKSNKMLWYNTKTIV